MTKTCTHPPDKQRFWTVSEPKIEDGEHIVMNEKGQFIYQDLIVGGCSECCLVFPPKVLKEHPLDSETQLKRRRIEV